MDYDQLAWSLQGIQLGDQIGKGLAERIVPSPPFLLTSSQINGELTAISSSKSASSVASADPQRRKNGGCNGGNQCTGEGFKQDTKGHKQDTNREQREM